MKRVIAVLCLVVFAMSFVSCSTVKVVSDGGFAFLAPEKGGSVKEVREKGNWYAVWGLVPLGDNSTKDVIDAKEKVRVRTYVSFLDGLISAFTSMVTIVKNTTEVEVLK